MSHSGKISIFLMIMSQSHPLCSIHLFQEKLCEGIGHMVESSNLFSLKLTAKVCIDLICSSTHQRQGIYIHFA